MFLFLFRKKKKERVRGTYVERQLVCRYVAVCREPARRPSISVCIVRMMYVCVSVTTDSWFTIL